MKKLILLAVIVWLLPVYAQDIPIIGDTTDLKNHTQKQIVILSHFGGGDETGGGLFRRIDSTYAEGTNAFNYAALDGLQWVRMQYMGDEQGAFTDLSAIGTVDIAPVGAHTDHVIDFSDVVLDYSGSSGPVMIRAGTYGSPVSSSDPHQSGMIRLYGSNDAATDDGTGFYDRGLFVYLRTDKAKGIHPIAGLAEVRTTAGDGPVEVMGGQFIAGLHTSGAKLNAGGWGMFGTWNKIYSESGSDAEAGTKVAAIWLDNEMNGTVSGEEYTIFATVGVGKPDAFIGFENGASGWENFLYFDETAYDEDPISNLGAKNEVNSDKSIKISLNGTTYYIPIFVVANME